MLQRGTSEGVRCDGRGMGKPTRRTSGSCPIRAGSMSLVSSRWAIRPLMPHLEVSVP